MDSGTATVLAAGFGSLATIGVAFIGAWSSWRTSETRIENDRLRKELRALRGAEGESDDT